MKRTVLVLLAASAVIMSLSQCAKVVSPTGGPKDTLAPVMLKSNPAIYSTNFKAEKIVLTFNEYVKLKDQQKEFLVSPPLKNNPETRIKGKSVEITLKDTLLENTTYSVYFGNSIVDNNEGNPLKRFVYPFSTGSKLDTMAFAGTVINALSLEPIEGIMVHLYANHSDSIPFKSRPSQIARTNKNGEFTFYNIAAKDYKIFALKDDNSNYLFDQESETIAFSDSIVKSSSLTPVTLNDTVKTKMTFSITLNAFNEKSQKQVLADYKRESTHKFRLSFNKTVEGNIILKPLYIKHNNSWFIKEYVTAGKDTIDYWITDAAISKFDTISVQLSYLKTDSLGVLRGQTDTLKLRFTPKSKSANEGKKGLFGLGSDEEEVIKKETLKITTSVKKNGDAIIEKPFDIDFNIPLANINKDFITLKDISDSTNIENYTLLMDSLNPRLYHLNHNWETDKRYSIEMLPGAFIGLDGLENDTISFGFKGANPENYGIIFLTVTGTNKPVIAQLYDSSKKLVAEQKGVANEKITFTYLSPGKYRIKVIEDTNSNGLWDTGWYIKGIQPERVVFFTDPKTKGEINIRANWENEISVTFK
ncbi:MAG: Ig-like domain-containing protein [Bacteroidales bacterium]|nr:Ig-like domain-containing protein [Bacteroidales bacterium]MBN2750062.1 Ig-like domain-containing protein [Bacteroidales bacterium]